MVIIKKINLDTEEVNLAINLLKEVYGSEQIDELIRLGEEEGKTKELSNKSTTLIHIIRKLGNKKEENNLKHIYEYEKIKENVHAYESLKHDRVRILSGLITLSSLPLE